MVAYSFNKRFAGPIQLGTKTQTIRAERKRHARPGEAVSLFCGMRTSGCFRIIPDPLCTEVLPVAISVSRDEVFLNLGSLLDEKTETLCGFSGAGLDLFAVRDGFRNWADMKGFWLDTHPEASGKTYWEGFLINWGKPYRLIAMEGRLYDLG